MPNNTNIEKKQKQNKKQELGTNKVKHNTDKKSNNNVNDAKKDNPKESSNDKKRPTTKRKE